MTKDSRPIVIVDADVIVAQSILNDSNHNKALHASNTLKEIKARIVYSATAILEAVTVIQKKRSSVLAYNVANLLTKDRVEVAQVDDDILANAMAYFNPTTSKKNTLFDCVIMAVANKYNTDIIFSFDKFYTKQGFRLVSEF